MEAKKYNMKAKVTAFSSILGRPFKLGLKNFNFSIISNNMKERQEISRKDYEK